MALSLPPASPGTTDRGLYPPARRSRPGPAGRRLPGELGEQERDHKRRQGPQLRRPWIIESYHKPEEDTGRFPYGRAS